ncbi:MAG: hypothetical protein JRG91_14940 [Deltaproteobacteria bacterium]|nr:hypothetical protein [Deltaproteobacteria bacterium]
MTIGLLALVGCLAGCEADKKYTCSCTYICEPPFSGGTVTDWSPEGIIKAESEGQAESRAESLCDEQSAATCGGVVFENCLCSCSEAD